MPLYEYQCEECGVRFERRQRMTDEPITECPECGGCVHRVYFPVGVVFKGSGFYVTDNRAKKSTMRPTSDTTSEKSEKTTTVSESKAASATESKSSSGTGNKSASGSGGDD